jgi:hypothetical protein
MRYLRPFGSFTGMIVIDPPALRCILHPAYFLPGFAFVKKFFRATATRRLADTLRVFSRRAVFVIRLID